MKNVLLIGLVQVTTTATATTTAMNGKQIETTHLGECSEWATRATRAT